MKNYAGILAIISFAALNIEASADSKNKFYVSATGGVVFYNKLKERILASFPGVPGADIHSVYGARPKNSWSASLALGHSFNKYISAEILGRFSPLKYKQTVESDSSSSITTQDMKSYAVFANIYFKCPTKKIRPYISFGPGFVHNKLGAMKGQDTKSIATPYWSAQGRSINSFAWNIGTGVMLMSNSNFSVKAGYQYISLGKMGRKKDNMGGLAETRKIISHEILVGLTYQFN